MERLPMTLHNHAMELTNLEGIPGRTITRHLGLVQGSTVRSKHAGRDLMAGLKNFVGGELKGYTELLNESRNEAIDRMVQQAHARPKAGTPPARRRYHLPWRQKRLHRSRPALAAAPWSSPRCCRITRCKAAA
jgi:hypothetical protein